MRRFLLVALLIAAAACGGKHSAPAKPTGAGSGSGSDMAMEHHEGEPDEMSPELKKFHDLLSPLWHAPKGPERMKNTCAAVAEIKADADAIATATPPVKANADTWTAGTRSLVDAASNLADACKAGKDTTFEAAFEKVHDSFHALVKMAGMHESHEGMEGMDHEM